MALTKIQKVQNQDARVAYGPKDPRKSDRQIQSELGWLPIADEVKVATYKQVYYILNINIPEEMAIKMHQNKAGRRIEQQQKLGTKPRWLGGSRSTSFSFRTPYPKYYYTTDNSQIQKSIKKIFSVTPYSTMRLTLYCRHTFP